MVDTAIFVGMTGAKRRMEAMSVVTNNLANLDTIAYLSDHQLVQSQGLKGEMESRLYSASQKTYPDFKHGPLITTGRDLDVALDGNGFIAIQTHDGREAYTRGGNLKLTPEGVLVSNTGNLVLGRQGTITVPRATRLSISENGMIRVQLPGQAENTLTDVGQLKLVDIAPQDLVKGKDGLLYMKDEGSASASDAIKLITGSLEGSNVDTAQSLVDLIDLSRNFEIQTHLMRSIEKNAQKANELLNIAS